MPFSTKKFPVNTSVSWLLTLHFWVPSCSIYVSSTLLSSSQSHSTPSETCSSSVAPPNTPPKGSPCLRHLKEDTQYWEERSKSNLLWTCAYVLPFLNSEQLFLYYFICIHIGTTNTFLQLIQKSASGIVCARISAENVFAPQSKTFIRCAETLSSSSD